MARERFVDEHVGMTALRSCHPENACCGHVAVERCNAAGVAWTFKLDTVEHGRQDIVLVSTEASPQGRASRGPKGRAGKVFETIRDPHKTRNTQGCGMERTIVTQNSEGGGFRKSPQRNLPEQKTRRYAGAGGGREADREGEGEGGGGGSGRQEGARGPVCRDLTGGRREALQVGCTQPRRR